jgi:quercetin dioxygenase-like cupin family protein
MAQRGSPARVNPSEEVIAFGAISIRILVAGADAADTLSLFEVSARPSAGVPPHRNETFEETIYGVEGSTIWTVNGAPFAVGPGQALCIRRGEPHQFANASTTTARVLVAVTPPVLGAQHFRDVAAELAAAAGASPDPAKMQAIMRRHGMTPVASADA